MNYTWPLWRAATRDDRIPLSKTLPSDYASLRSRRKSAPDAFITIEKLSKQVGGEQLYADFDVSLPQGEFISIYGPEGAGRKALLQIMSGLVPADGGRVLYNGKPIGETRIAYVFGDHRKALLPWLSAIDNIRHPLDAAGLTRDEQDRRIVELLSGVHIRFDLQAYPYQLTAGDRQLVAILRAMAVKPDTVLLEDPFAGVDAHSQLFLRDQLQTIFLTSGATMVLASHDIEEAIQLSDKVLILAGQPIRVAQIVNIDLPWPRTASVRSAPTFTELKNRCLEVYRHEAAA